MTHDGTKVSTGTQENPCGNGLKCNSNDVEIVQENYYVEINYSVTDMKTM